MFQVKRILLFIPLCVLLPTLSVALSYMSLSKLGIDSSSHLSIAVLYIVSSLTILILYWWFSSSLISQPFQHGIIVYIASSLISLALISTMTNQFHYSPTLLIDIFISLTFMVLGIKMGYRNKEQMCEEVV